MTPIPIHTVANRTEMLGNIATLSPAVLPVVINHHNGAPVFDIFANTQDSDLESVAAKVNKIVKEESKSLPPGTKIVVRGQVESMNMAFNGLGLGLTFAALLVYLLMVVNYRLSKAEQQEMVLEYQKTILGALKDVSSSLVSYKETRERRQEELAQVTSAADAVRLARLRYAGGNTSYLEVLTTDTNLYDAQLALSLAQQQEVASLVQLYAALGGGW